MRRILLAFTATALVVAITYIGQPAATTTTVPAPAQITVDIATTPGDGPLAQPTADVPAELNRLIGVFERRTADSVDALDFRTLGGHYATRANLTGSIEDYQRSADAYATAYELAPTDRAGQIAYANAAAAIHDFETALRLAEKTLGEVADDLDALATAGDAAAELGNLELAADYYNRLDTLAPDHPAVLVRLAGLAHLNGEQDQAIALAGLAYEEAQAGGEDSNTLTFYPLLLSDLLLDAGRYDEAIVQARAGVQLSRSGIALASLGRSLAHSGQFADAIATYEQALALQDDPGWHVAIGDILTASGEIERAATHYDSAITILAAGDEATTGQSLATIYSDLDINPAEALGLAERDLARRQSIDAYDTLAWSLYRNGRIEEAREAIDAARATGAQDATLIYHSAVIAAAGGDQAHAVAELNELLGRNPGFHPLHSRHAVELLASLVG